MNQDLNTSKTDMKKSFGVGQRMTLALGIPLIIFSIFLFLISINEDESAIAAAILIVGLILIVTGNGRVFWKHLKRGGTPLSQSLRNIILLITCVLLVGLAVLFFASGVIMGLLYVVFIGLSLYLIQIGRKLYASLTIVACYALMYSIGISGLAGYYGESMTLLIFAPTLLFAFILSLLIINLTKGTPHPQE